MKITMKLTVDDLIRALTLRAHGLADEIENKGRIRTGAGDNGNAKPREHREQPR